MRFARPLIALAALTISLSAAIAEPRHAIALHGEPALPAGFAHLPYVNPEAPRGGRLVIGQQGTFDSLNAFIARGSVPDYLTGYLVQSLMMRSLDEPFSLYGLIAESVDLAPDRSSIAFRLRPQARFSDGTPLTSADVAFTFRLLRDKGRPAQRANYRRVTAVETPEPTLVRFVLPDPDDVELPMLLALMPVLASHATPVETFEQPTFRPPTGSGPYVLAELVPGSSFTLRRNPAFWASDLPILRGLFNVDEIKVDFYRDSGAFFEAFKAGLYDFRVEQDPARWLEGYDGPALRDGRIVKEAFSFEAPRGMSGFVFNTRRSVLADRRVREALSQPFDFEWLNRNLFGGVYRRMESFFDASELASTGRHASARERAILAPFPDEIRADVLDGSWRPPRSDGSGRDRQRLQDAADLLARAGWRLSAGRMSDAAGQPLDFEILVKSREEERIALAYAQTLRPLGITASVRLVDSSQYWRRLRVFDYDVIIWQYGVSASPGNEQSNRWSSAAADREASLNFAGVRSSAVDAALDAVLRARSRPDFVDAVRSLDRALLSGSYVLPLYYLPERWVARSATLERPPRLPRFEMTVDAWWRRQQ